MDAEHKDILLEKYEEFNLEEDQARKKLLRLEIFNILKEVEEPDSDDSHIWGLTHYMSDDDKEYNRNQALEKFLEAYKLDSTNFLACLYAAHCFHDMGELQSALKYYERVNKTELKEFQIWRYVKLIEQIGFCHYKLGNQSQGRKQFQKVLEWYRKLPIDDRAVPTEMFQCLPDSDDLIIKMKEIEDYLE